LPVRSLNLIENFFVGDGVFDKLNSREVADVAWDAARKTFRQHPTQPNGNNNQNSS